jgi:zinc protease
MERIRRQMLPLLFRGSAYALRAPIGLPHIIENAPAGTLQNFYKTWYRADNMALIFVGDFDGAALEASLTSHFSMPSPNTPLNRPSHDLPPPKKGTSVEIFTDPELPFTAAYLYYKREPKPLTGDLAGYREALIDALIDTMLSRRFDEEASKPETPYIGAGGWHTRYGVSSRYYELFARAKAGAAEAALNQMLLTKESLSRYGFTEAEIDRAKRSLISALIRQDSEKDRQESRYYIHEFTSHFLTGTTVPDIDWELESARQLLPGVSAQEIAAAVKEYFGSGDLQIFVLAPETEQGSLPSKERILKMAAEAQKAKIDPPREETLTDKLLDRPPQSGAVVSEALDPETGALVWELSNGGRVILKETANRNNEIIFYALARGGVTSAPQSEYRSAQFAAEMLEVSGVGSYSLQDLQKKLAGKQVSISFWSGPFTRGFQGSSTTEDLKIFFELLHLYFTQPRMDPPAIQALRDQLRTTLIQRKQTPDTAFSEEIQRIMYGNHPQFAPLEAEDLNQIQPDQAMGFIKKSLNPKDYTFVFVGNLNSEDLRGYVETYVASIPQTKESWNAWTDPKVIRPGKLDIPLYKGREERSRVYLGRYLPSPYSEEDEAAAAVFEEYLDIRLTQEIREKLGGVYSISARVSLSPVPPNELGLTVSFGCDPKRVNELVRAVEQELRRAASEPVDPDIFSKAVAALKKSWETAVQRNGFIARSYANSAVIYQGSLGRLNSLPGLYDGITPQAMQTIGQRIVSKEPVQIVLYPEQTKN